MLSSPHVWITCTVTRALLNAFDPLDLSLGEGYFFDQMLNFGKLFLFVPHRNPNTKSVCLSRTLSKFCFPFQEKVSDWKSVWEESLTPPQITPGSLFWHAGSFISSPVWFCNCVTFLQFLIILTCGPVVDQRSNFSRDSSKCLNRQRPNGR